MIVTAGERKKIKPAPESLELKIPKLLQKSWNRTVRQRASSIDQKTVLILKEFSHFVLFPIFQGTSDSKPFVQKILHGSHNHMPPRTSGPNPLLPNWICVVAQVCSLAIPV